MNVKEFFDKVLFNVDSVWRDRVAYYCKENSLSEVNQDVVDYLLRVYPSDYQRALVIKNLEKCGFSVTRPTDYSLINKDIEVKALKVFDELHSYLFKSLVACNFINIRTMSYWESLEIYRNQDYLYVNVSSYTRSNTTDLYKISLLKSSLDNVVFEKIKGRKGQHTSLAFCKTAYYIWYNLKDLFKHTKINKIITRFVLGWGLSAEYSSCISFCKNSTGITLIETDKSTFLKDRMEDKISDFLFDYEYAVGTVQDGLYDFDKTISKMRNNLLGLGVNTSGKYILKNLCKDEFLVENPDLSNLLKGIVQNKKVIELGVNIGTQVSLETYLNNENVQKIFDIILMKDNSMFMILKGNTLCLVKLLKNVYLDSMEREIFNYKNVGSANKEFSKSFEQSWN